MLRYFQIFTVFLGMLLSGMQVHAQVYEYTPTAVGCSKTWADGNCWNKTPLNEPINCAESGDWPPFAPTGCNVEVIINDDLVIPGEVEFGGSFASLTIGNEAVVTFSGNLSIEGQKNILFYLEGESFINVTGALTISQGGTSTPTVLNLGGDGLGMVTVSSINIENKAVLEVLEGGAITSEGPTEYSGNSSKINVTGFFRTQSLLVTGGREHQFNTYGDSQVVIDFDIDIRGDTGITIGGTSEVYVGRDVLVDGSATIIADDNSKIFVCGAFPPPEEGGRAQEIEEGKFFPCGVLPVELLDQKVEYHNELRKVKFTWATGKEMDLRYFTVERAVGTPDLFEPLTHINGAGSSTEIGSYEWWDTNLPLYKSRVYYRLVQVDVNGDEKFIGEVLALDIPATDFESSGWMFFPNPNWGGEATISILNQEKYNGELIDLAVYGSFGEAVSLKNKDLESLNRELPGKIKPLPTGVYFFHVRWGNQRQILKVLKR
ncbi:T9SS type A sorting domain-containing protein [Cyclobacterium jeungdonense]|uniref:T9SS type A sorting domain-containing protein n=1 Tax=Cyclobacterium jeungdonense TaxID=708087 RepID=A0ABT8C579_9BACT|nr:T9SS type A sorting domain-containing protein [Cyclobacterium jeungdonense]MDN3687940.1 T9SS type A sorting domain-containing protein [Cyclobacterium jeungdonense]